jgi:FixJ family two-component response regulator
MQHAPSTAPKPTAKPAPATVLVVDDDISIRESLEALIQVCGWEARTFASATAFLESRPPPGPSCLVLDVSLPDLNGLDLQARIADERAEMPIIFITGYGDVPTSVRAMKAGAAEFLTKRSASAVGERAALQVLRERRASLSRRECEVMDLVASGLLNKQVGGELGISEITVKAHRGRVMEKMQAGSLADLVRMSERLGLHTGRARYEGLGDT